MFTDHAKIFLKAGHGGNGCVSFRREKFVPHGGPDGGNGGSGGSVYFRCTEKLNTLNKFRKRSHFTGDDGTQGQGHSKTGRSGADVFIKVPPGTIVKDENGKVLADLYKDGEDFLICRGGRGGRGNENFKTPVNQAPRVRELGEPGEEAVVSLELKLIADVGLVGFPNSGKSTFISVVSNCKPKIADYPFTTLVPNLGIVDFSGIDDFIVADIPGLIEGASEGKGLGHEFLRHVERVRALLFLIDINDLSPVDSFRKLYRELQKYSADIIKKRKVIAFTKQDTFTDEEYFESFKREILDEYDEMTPERILFISSVSGYKIKEVLHCLNNILEDLPKEYHLIEKTHHVYSLPEEQEVTITESNGIFSVNGPDVEKLILMTDLDSEECLMRLQRQLLKMGIIEQLQNAGVDYGDTVRIGEFEFLWE